MAIDGHVIACSAESGDLSAFGYKAKKLGTPQINWMIAYDVQTKLPLCSEMFNGSDPDKTVVEVMFSRFHFENTLFLVDRGFNTQKDKELFSANGNTYIVPMIGGRTDYEAVYEVLKFDKRKSFVYDKDGYSSLIYYETYVMDDNPVHYIAFLDTTRQSAEGQTYIKKMNAKEKGYTQEGLLESEKDFGLFLLETNDLKKKPQEVFCDYKSRWGIETFYNYIDNTLDFNALYQKDFCSTQGLGFIIQISGMIFHDLQRELKEKGLTVKDTMFTLKGLKVIKERDRYVVRNDNKQRKKLCEKLELNLSKHGVT
jgi:transposase